MKHNHFRYPLILAFVLILISSSCASASEPTVMPASMNMTEPAMTATQTVIPTPKPLPTATPDLAATQQYNDFFSLVQKFYNAGQISSTEGKYVELDDYKHEYSVKLSYAWTMTDVSAKNFILRADFEWDNAIDTMNISGCGFVYRVQPNQDHYFIILDAFSGVKLASSTDRGTHSMGSPQNGEQTLPDFGSGPYHATFTLIVNELKTYVYVNDVYYGEYKLLDYRITDSGPLGTAVLSAASEGYGTRCKMTNVRAWVIDP